jgi:hypothetical protein
VFISTFCFLLSALAQSAIPEDAELMGRCAAQTNGLVRLSKAEWKEIEIARKGQSGVAMSYGEVCTNRACNSVAFTTRLIMVESEIIEPFARANGRRPYSQETLAAWLVGVPQFKKLKYDFSKIRDPAMNLVIQKFDYEKRLANLVRTRPPPPAPPLPLP